MEKPPGKNPGFYFYPGDWTRDLDDQDLEIEGAWIRICCRLWWSDTKGEVTKSLKEWSKCLRTHPNKTKTILETLLKKGICDGGSPLKPGGDIENNPPKKEGGILLNPPLEFTHILDNQNITIISRRMVRDFKLSQTRQRVGKLGGNPTLLKQPTEITDLDNQTNNQSPNQKGLSSSSSSSSLAFTNVKAGETAPPASLEEEKSEEETPFSVGDPKKEHFEQSLKARDNGTLQKILKACEGFKGRKDFNPFQFIQRNKTRHPMALLKTIERLSSTLARGTPIDKVWPYAEKIVRVESKNFREADAIASHKRLMDELRRLYPRDPTVRDDE